MNQELLFIWYFPQFDGCFKIIDKAASNFEIRNFKGREFLCQNIFHMLVR